MSQNAKLTLRTNRKSWLRRKRRNRTFIPNLEVYARALRGPAKELPSRVATPKGMAKLSPKTKDKTAGEVRLNSGRDIADQKDVRRGTSLTTTKDAAREKEHPRKQEPCKGQGKINARCFHCSCGPRKKEFVRCLGGLEWLGFKRHLKRAQEHYRKEKKNSSDLADSSLTGEKENA